MHGAQHEESSRQAAPTLRFLHLISWDIKSICLILLFLSFDFVFALPPSHRPFTISLYCHPIPTHSSSTILSLSSLCTRILSSITSPQPHSHTYLDYQMYVFASTLPRVFGYPPPRHLPSPTRTPYPFLTTLLASIPSVSTRLHQPYLRTS